MHGFLMQHEIRSREVHMGEFACQITSPPPFFSPRHHILSNIKEEVGLSACAHHHLLSGEKQGSALTLTGPPPLSFLQAYVNRCNFDLPASVQNHKMSPPPPRVVHALFTPPRASLSLRMRFLQAISNKVTSSLSLLSPPSHSRTPSVACKSCRFRDLPFPFLLMFG